METYNSKKIGNGWTKFGAIAIGIFKVELWNFYLFFPPYFMKLHKHECNISYDVHVCKSYESFNIFIMAAKLKILKGFKWCSGAQKKACETFVTVYYISETIFIQQFIWLFQCLWQIKTEFTKFVSPVRHDQQNFGRFC
jgi:hypothetical protein